MGIDEVSISHIFFLHLDTRYIIETFIFLMGEILRLTKIASFQCHGKVTVVLWPKTDFTS